ncbi:MAG TPA: universal stress protein [Chloroflexota bacterium]
MFSRVLVPLDGSSESNVALPLARTLAQASGASITLLRVVPSTVLPADQIASEEAQRSLDRIAGELASAGVRVDAAVREGDPAEQILEQTRATAADLIVMRTHGRAGVERAVLGSVTQRVLAGCAVPLAVLRPDQKQISHVRSLLVPVDGSPGGALALGAAVGLAQVTHAAIKLIEVSVPIPMEVYAGYGGMTYYDPAWDEDALAAARAYVSNLAQRLRGRGLAVDAEARMAPSVAATIVAAADASGADLIVMSTQALTGVARLLLGSVADAVVRTAHCPTLLVHRTGERPPLPEVHS